MISSAPNDEDRRAYLEALARSGDDPLDIAEAALILASYERPGVPLERYRAHLQDLITAARDRIDPQAPAADRVERLVEVIAGANRYEGDRRTYDDLQNANLMRVIDRRRGLPVSLGILYLHTARAVGWQAAGLSFPNHFLIRLDVDGERVVLDPFSGGNRLGASDLRQMLGQMVGEIESLEAHHHADVADRMVLLRLQNNIKLRLLGDGKPEAALGVIDRMRFFAPELAALWRESGIINAKLGNLRTAIADIEGALQRLAGADLERHDLAKLAQDLRSRLN